ncbi:MAG: VOC family protein [Pseudodonghicola sp.]|nr:VOC family protein [Pseudodonghicola sp.]
MRQRGFRARALGEIAIRCVDLQEMVAFYRDVIGLEPLNVAESSPIVFLRVAEGFDGHTAVLALFRHDVEGAGKTRGRASPPETGPGSSLHHIAFSLPWDEQDAVIAWYEHLGRDYTVEYFDWVGWRGVFTFDPDGNTIELVAKDPGWSAPSDILRETPAG